MKPLIAVFGMVAALVPVILYIVQFQGGLATEHARWGEFGSYLSGMYGSLAMIILVYTTHLTKIQFKKQNEDTVFYKLFDSLQSRIQHSSVVVEGQEFAAYKSLKYMAEQFHFELSLEAVEIGRMLFCKAPETVAQVHYSKLFEALTDLNLFNTPEGDLSSFMSDIKSEGDFNERWERLKSYIGSHGEESEAVKDALRATGCVNFYKIPYDERHQHYSRALQRMLANHGDFLDGYFRTLLFIADMVDVSHNRNQYISYINSQLTRYEVVILFYMIAGREDPTSKALNIKSLGLLDRLLTMDCQTLMIDFPGNKAIESELRNAFADEC
jgi:hypothetical protein